VSPGEGRRGRRVSVGLGTQECDRFARRRLHKHGFAAAAQRPFEPRFLRDAAPIQGTAAPARPSHDGPWRAVGRPHLRVVGSAAPWSPVPSRVGAQSSAGPWQRLRGRGDGRVPSRHDRHAHPDDRGITCTVPRTCQLSKRRRRAAAAGRQSAAGGFPRTWPIPPVVSPGPR